MAKSSEPDQTSSLDFTAHFDPGTRVPEPALSDEDRKRLDEMGVIGASDLDERGFYASIVRSAPPGPRKAPEETTILVIEDDPVTAQVGQAVLKKSGYRTRLAGNRAEIVQELGRKPGPDLILLDVILPNNLNGFDILNRIRQRQELMHIPVVMLTSLGQREHIVKGLMLGADGYLTKPAKPAVLTDMVQKILTP